MEKGAIALLALGVICCLITYIMTKYRAEEKCSKCDKCAKCNKK